MILLITAEEYRNDKWTQGRAYLYTKHRSTKRALKYGIAKAQRNWPGFKSYTARPINPHSDQDWKLSKEIQETMVWF